MAFDMNLGGFWEWSKKVPNLPVPILLPLFSIISPALINAFPPNSPTDFFPASTNPSTEFQMMFEMKLVIFADATRAEVTLATNLSS